MVSDRDTIMDAALSALSEPEMSRVVHKLLRELRSGERAGWFVDAVFQTVRKPDICDAYVFARLGGDVAGGRLQFARVHVGATPAGDRERAENQRRLSRLPREFSARVFGDQAHGPDGLLSWAYPVKVAPVSWVPLDADDAPPCETTEGRLLEPGSSPLEIGYQDSAKTLITLYTHGRLARWAYDSEDIVLMHLSPSGIGVLNEKKTEGAEEGDDDGQ